MYYLRTKAAADAIKFTVQKQANTQIEPVLKEDNCNVEKINKEEVELACSIENPDDCEMCGS